MSIFNEQFPKKFHEYKLENKILGINGSPRKNGNSDFLLNHLLQNTQEKGISSHAIYLRDHQYSSCIGCEKCQRDKLCTGLKDGLSSLYPLLLSSKGLVLVSPAHNYNVTAWMKAFIDRLYCFYDFANSRPRSWSSRLANQNRKAVIIGICEQEKKEDMGYTIDAMEKPLQALGYEIVSKVPVYGVFDRGAVKNKTEVLNQIDKIGTDFTHSMMLD